MSVYHKASTVLNLLLMLKVIGCWICGQPLHVLSSVFCTLWFKHMCLNLEESIF